MTSMFGTAGLHLWKPLQIRVQTFHLFKDLFGDTREQYQLSLGATDEALASCEAEQNVKRKGKTAMGNRQYPKGLRLLVICLCLSASWLVLSPARTVQAQSSDPIHIVQPAETLSSIAARYGISYLQLARYNGIANPNLIRSGQRLRIPSLTSTPAIVSSPQVNRSAPIEQPPAVVRSLPPCHGELSYTVRRGDSLSGISIYYNVTVNALRARNNLPSSLILVDQRLIIPSTC